MQKIEILLIVCIFLLSSCVPAIPTTVATISTLNPSNTPQPTQTPFPSKTSMPTATPIRTFIVNSQCPLLSSSLPHGIAKGVISHWGRNRDFRVLLSLETGEKYVLPGESLARAIVSQDRNIIAYSEHDPNTLELYLVVRVLDAQKSIERPWPSSRSDLSRWHDTERLLFTEYSTAPPYSHLVYNPFTGETILLPSNYPEISHGEINWERAGSVVYDQTLEFVVYAAWNEAEKKHEYVLWSIPSQTKLAALPGNSYGGYSIDYAGLIPKDGVSYNPPVWSTDDTRVAVISLSPDNSKVDEIFTMAKDGEIQQLTEFSNEFEKVNIRTLAWSPDGEQIAFFFTTEPGPYRTRRNERLAIFDIETREVTLYCIDGDIIGTRAGMFIGDEQQTPAPLWSPDGSQLIIENRYEEDASRLILLDIPSNKAYEVGQNMQPFGWMLRRPSEVINTPEP